MKAYIIVQEWRQVEEYTPKVYLNKETALKNAEIKKRNDINMNITCSNYSVEEININEK